LGSISAADIILDGPVVQQLIWAWNWVQQSVPQSAGEILAAGLCLLTLLSASLAIFFSARLRTISLRQRRLAQAMEAQALLLEKLKDNVENMLSTPAPLLIQAAAKENNPDMHVALLREELASLRMDLIAEQKTKKSSDRDLVIS
jgi:hypothetical protein